MRRIYHFLPAKWAIDDLLNSRLKISIFSDLNDPFELLNCEMSNKDYRKAFNKTKEDIDKKYGVICFSKNWHNTLLWSHYADKHKGICLGFDASYEFLEKVRYIGTRIELNQFIKLESKLNQNKPDETKMKKIWFAKYKGWNYEDEVRLFSTLEEKDAAGLYFKDFCNDLVLKQVIIGVRCNKSKNEIKEYVNRYNNIG